MPERMWRYYSFQAHWATDVDLFVIRNGSGDELFIVFTPEAILAKGFSHESVRSPYRVNPPKVWQGILDDIPNSLTRFIDEPAFSFNQTTFCFWQDEDSDEWQYSCPLTLDGEDIDGSQRLLSILDGSPRTYQTWASSYYGTTVPLDLVKAIYAHTPLNRTLIRLLNADCDGKTVLDEADKIQYPLESQ